jgi:hypothetical protein
MILATTKVEDFDRFLKTFSTKGAAKRKQHGSKGSTVFRRPIGRCFDRVHERPGQAQRRALVGRKQAD